LDDHAGATSVPRSAGNPAPAKEKQMGELLDRLKGNVNEAVGSAKQQSHDPETRAKGKAQEIKGKAQQVKGAIKGALGDDI
jgi:uncharacterized protein YjbJ (UPF0337 family)